MDAITLMIENFEKRYFPQGHTVSKSNLHYVQCIQGTASRMISNTSKYTSITPFL